MKFFKAFPSSVNLVVQALDQKISTVQVQGSKRRNCWYNLFICIIVIYCHEFPAFIQIPIFRHLDLISPNLRIFRCEITLTRALDFMRLGFRFIAPFGRKLIEAQMGQKWCKCQAPNYGNYQVIFEFTMFVFWVPNFDRFPLMIREKTAHISWWKSRVVIPRMLATRRVRRFCECCVAPSVGCWCMRLLGCR